MVGHEDGPATGDEGVSDAGQHIGDGGEFLVDLDSECLECAFGGVAAGASGGGGDGIIEQFDEPRGGGEGGVFAFIRMSSGASTR